MCKAAEYSFSFGGLFPSLGRHAHDVWLDHICRYLGGKLGIFLKTTTLKIMLSELSNGRSYFFCTTFENPAVATT